MLEASPATTHLVEKLLFRGALAVAGTLATLAIVWSARWRAAARRKAFLPALGKVVRIATPCRIPKGSALVPGTLALTPEGLVWDGLFELSGQASFPAIQRLETDRKLLGRAPFFRAGVVRVTLVSGDVKEFVVSKGHHWEWRQALGEWVAAGGKIRTSSAPAT